MDDLIRSEMLATVRDLSQCLYLNAHTQADAQHKILSIIVIFLHYIVKYFQLLFWHFI